MGSEDLWIAIACFGILIGIFCRSLKIVTKYIPYSVLLLLIGAITGVIAYFIQKDGVLLTTIGAIDPHNFMQILLPSLIFFSVFCIHYHTVIRVFWLAALLAGPGVLINSLLTMPLCTSMIYNWNWKIALLFGTIISATDPVAVVTLLKDIKASQHLSTLIEAESLFNDASAIVIFKILVIVINEDASKRTARHYLMTAGFMIAAPLIGISFGLVASLWIYLIHNDNIIETSVTFVAANGVYLFSEYINSSGVLATVAMGLVMIRYKANISPKSIANLEHFWELMEYFAKTMIFLLSGTMISLKASTTSNISWPDVGWLFVIYLWVHLTRAVTLVLLHPLMRMMDREYTWKASLILWYGSLRGAIGLSLALIVEEIDGIPLKIREKIVFHTCGIVVLTLIINGTTIKYLLRFLNIKGAIYKSDFLIKTSLNHLMGSSHKLLLILAQNNHFSGAKWIKVRENLPDYTKLLKTNEYEMTTEVLCETNIRYRFICSMRSFYFKQLSDGMITTHAYNILFTAAEIAIDKNDIEAQWEDIRYHFRIPKIFVWMRKLKFLKKIANSILYDRIFLAFQLSAAFIFASDRMRIIVNTFPEWKVKELKQVEIELHCVEKKAQLEWQNIQKTFPEVYQAIQTRNATVYILNKDIHNIIAMRKQGIIQDVECEEMIANIDKRIRELDIFSMADYEIDSFTFFTNLPFVNALSVDLQHTLFSKTNYKIYSEDSYLFKAGSKKNGFYVIMKGLVEMSKNGKVAMVYGPGTIINLWASIYNSPSINTCQCKTTVTLLKVPTTVCMEILAEKKSAEILWKCAGFTLCKVLYFDDMEVEKDQFKLGEICLSSTLHKINGERIVSCEILLLKGTAMDALNKYVAPALVKLRPEALSSKDGVAVNLKISFVDAVALFLDGKGIMSGGFSDFAANISVEKSRTIDRQESLGLIYIKGSEESNRTQLGPVNYGTHGIDRNDIN